MMVICISQGAAGWVLHGYNEDIKLLAAPRPMVAAALTEAELLATVHALSGPVNEKSLPNVVASHLEKAERLAARARAYPELYARLEEIAGLPPSQARRGRAIARKALGWS